MVSFSILNRAEIPVDILGRLSPKQHKQTNTQRKDTYLIRLQQWSWGKMSTLKVSYKIWNVNNTDTDTTHSICIQAYATRTQNDKQFSHKTGKLRKHRNIRTRTQTSKKILSSPKLLLGIPLVDNTNTV